MDRCPHCDCSQRVKKRDFPAEALTKLVAMGELAPEVAGLPICDDCADDLRQVLIEEQEGVEE